MMLNIKVAWIGFFLGCIAGAVPGLFFHNKEWLGGYSSWERRMIRLAHISFFGIGLLNISFGLTAQSLHLDEATLRAPSILLIASALAMPTVCYLSAWKKIFRLIFFIPALCAVGGTALFLWRVIAL